MVFTAVSTSVKFAVNGGMVWFSLSAFTTYSVSIAYTSMVAKFLAFKGSEKVWNVLFYSSINIADFYFFRNCRRVEG